MEPIAFLRRPCGIIPPPRRHLVRYSGILGRKDRHGLRALVPTDPTQAAGDAPCAQPRMLSAIAGRRDASSRPRSPTGAASSPTVGECGLRPVTAFRILPTLLPSVPHRLSKRSTATVERRAAAHHVPSPRGGRVSSSGIAP